ncbi:MAG: hypothetical protein JO345_02315 [Streptosporangiaceae bacterium]|nr:hypothetical protein [Streptosporangiaceae bacterium]
MIPRTRYRVTAALPPADLHKHSLDVTAVTAGTPLTCPVTGNAACPPRAVEVLSWA